MCASSLCESLPTHEVRSVFNLFRRDDFRPAVLTVTGDSADIEFADEAIRGITTRGGVRTRRVWLFWREYVRNEAGHYEVTFSGPDFEYAVRKILETLGCKVVGDVRYGTIKPDPTRKPSPATITYRVTRNGRTVVFDLSVK